MQNVNATLAVILGFSAFSLSDGIRKIAVHDYTVIDILFWQAICGMCIILLAAFATGQQHYIAHRSNIKQHLIRGVLIALNTMFSLQAISRIPMTDAYTIFFLAPLMTAIMAMIFLKEPIGKYRMCAILVGFCGVYIALNPSLTSLNPAYLYALALVLTFSSANVLARAMTQTKHVLPFAFWPLFILALGIIIYQGGTIPPMHDMYFIALCTAAGIAYSAGVTLVAYGFQKGEAATLAPYQYTQIIIALIFDYFLLSYIPTMQKLCGACIITATGIFVFMRENKAKGGQIQ